MTESAPQLRSAIQNQLGAFETRSLKDAALDLLAALGYTSDKTADFSSSPETFADAIAQATGNPLNPDKAGLDRWRECAFLFQLTNDEIPSLATGQTTLIADSTVAQQQIESFVFLALELDGEHWSRTDLAGITRELNRRFPMPAIVLFKHGRLISLAVIDRRPHRRDSTRDVIDQRITVIKDVRLDRPHRAHLEILAGLALENLGEKRRPTNFRELYDAWIAALSIQALNKRFYTELAWWYHWAVKQVDFPRGGGQDCNTRNPVAVIRLLTRLIFVWFIKEKGLIPDDLFEPRRLGQLLKSDPTRHPDDSGYYLAILQNLFFATLNVEMGKERSWASARSGMKSDRLIHSRYRHKTLFRDPDGALDLFATIPFLNGGLFECLDRELTERDFERNPELEQLAVREGNGRVLRVDGFSRRKDAQPVVPNKLFFGGETGVDLDDELGKSRRPRNVSGLIELFSRYKFTVDENTPLEEEVALDPELLGKVFENLLASYNPDTRTTARKQSGSFYTPREVVDYMVDEALIACFERVLEPAPTKHQRPSGKPRVEPLDFGTLPGELDLTLPDTLPAPTSTSTVTDDRRLRDLLSYADRPHGFSETETRTLIAAIERLRVLDPACGSGAFLMGMLAKLVHVLGKLDPGNALWRAENRKPLEDRLRAARASRDLTRKEAEIDEARAALEEFERDFSQQHADYTRKLYLIEKCIFGVDIQPIAVQIAKLRFFIALIVSQKVDPGQDNWGIPALPNLETKIVAANTLMSVGQLHEQTAGLDLQHTEIEAKKKELAEASEHYFAARTMRTKRKWSERIFELRDELAELIEEQLPNLEMDDVTGTGAAQQLVHWNPFDQNAAADFFDPEWMFQIDDGFDIVIGNPPYVRQEEIKHLKNRLKARYDCFTGTADLYVYFYERSVRLLKPAGVLSFITSNKWYRAKYGEKLRDWLNRHTRLRSIIDFGDEDVFTAIAYPTIVIATRRKAEVKRPVASDTVWALNWSPNQSLENFPAVFTAERFEVPQAELSKSGWQLEPPVKRRLLERIRAGGKPLGEYVQKRFYRGVLTGLNEAFVIDSAKRQQLITEDPESAEIIKPFLRGRDVKRWWAEPQDLWLIFTRRGIDISEYPAIYQHLIQYKQHLLPKPNDWPASKTWPGRKPGPYQWYEIQDNIAYWQEFERPKIIYPDIYEHQSFAWDTRGFFGGNTCYFIPTDARWITGLLNSSLIEWFYSQISNRIRGGYLRAFSDYMQQVPIPQPGAEQVTLIDAAVAAVLAGVDEPNFEQLINGLVYELFFPEDLHRANIRLFDACERADLVPLANLEGQTLTDAADELAERIFATDHPIYAMLFDLQALDVVRIIEGRE